MRDEIARSSVFSGLTAEQVEAVEDCAREQTFEAGAFLLREGEVANWFFLIRRGKVAIEVHVSAGGPLVIETLDAGDPVGLSWLFEPHRWQFDGRAVERSDVIAFDAACLRGKCESDHSLGYALMSRFAAVLIERLQATRLQLLDVYGRGRATV